MEESFLRSVKEDVEKMRNPELRMEVRDYVETFLSSKPKGNNVLLMGVDDKNILNEMLGRDVKVIKEGVTYFIRIIHNDMNKRSVIVSFTLEGKVISSEDKNTIIALFSAYQNNPEDGWELRLRKSMENNSIPNLIIDSNKIDDFLDNPHRAFLALSGNGYIKDIEIHTPLKYENGIYASFKNVHIFTKNYQRLRSVTKEGWKPKEEFWSAFSDANMDVYKYNFVILNNADDHLMEAYVSLIKMYKEKFSLIGNHQEMYKRIFYLSNIEYYNSIRSNELPRGLNTDVNSVHTDEQDARICYSLLEKIFESENNDFEKTKVQYQGVLDILDNIGYDKKNMISKLNDYYISLKELNDKISEFRTDYENWDFFDTTMRSKYLGYIRVIIDKANYIANNFNLSMQDEIKSLDQKYPKNDYRFGNISAYIKLNLMSPSNLKEQKKKSDEAFHSLVMTALLDCEDLVKNLYWADGEEWTQGIEDILRNDIRRYSNSQIKHRLTSFLLEKGYNKFSLPINFN